MEFAGEAVVGLAGGKLGETLPLNKNENAELNIFLPTSDFFGTVAAVLNIAAPILGLIRSSPCTARRSASAARPPSAASSCRRPRSTAAEGATMISEAFRASAERASKMAGYYRRAEDYVLQANQATSELEQYGRQIISSLLREQITKREYEHHLAADRAGAEAAEEFLRTKFTNEDLYTWMQGELSQTYYDCYKLAFDVAKRAEADAQARGHAPRVRRAATSSSSATGTTRARGLLAGETLEPRPQAPGDGVPGAEQARVRDDQARLAGPPRPAARC